MNGQAYFTRRHIVYIDPAIQKQLLVALIALEIVLVAGALWVLYGLLSAAVEGNLYSAHQASKPQIYPLLETAVAAMGALVAINFAALWIVGWMWARYLNSILQPLAGLMDRAGKLDFSNDLQPMAMRHKVLELACAWRNAERQRLLNLRAAIARLQDPGDTPSSPEAEKQARATLETIRRLLP